MAADGTVVFTKIHHCPVHLPCRAMTSPMSSSHSDFQILDQAKADLLSALVSPPPIYPWLPHHEDSEAYFADDPLGDDDPLIESALAEGWQRFSAQMTSQWANASAPRVATIIQRLKTQLQISLSDDLLHTLATAVATLEANRQTYLDRLVACAQAVLPTWDAGDLAVLARPLVYSLRDGHSEILDLNLQSIPQADWQNLSDIERARLSLTLAAFALKVVDQES